MGHRETDASGNPAADIRTFPSTSGGLRVWSVGLSSDEAFVQRYPTVSESAPHVRLIVLGDEAGQAIACRRVVTLLGSREGCKVRLRHQAVGPVHAAIINDGQQVRAVDLISPTGTKLNELKLEHEVLSDGDVLTMSHWSFRVEIQEAQDLSGIDAPLLDLEPSPQAIALEHHATKRILQPSRDVSIFGRRKGCDIVLSDRHVSRAHALLLNYLGHPAIVDLFSKHGTFVNDDRTNFRVLRDGDILAIGDTKFTVRVIESSVGRKKKDDVITSSPSSSATIQLDEPQDQIDIAHVEGSQSWRIADNLEKATRKA